MYEALLKSTPEYQKIAESLRTPGPAALFGLPPAGRALLYAALQKDLGRLVCIVTPGEAEATHFADDLKALGLTAAVFPPRDFMLRPVEGAGREYEYRRLSVLGALAVGMDLDHSFGGNGKPDVVLGLPMRPRTQKDIESYVKRTKLPFIIKGVLSAVDARKCLDAGVQGIVVSHHHGILPTAVPPLMVLPEIARVIGGRIPIFVDCGVMNGTDAFKCLALGATAVSVGRPVMGPIQEKGPQGACEVIEAVTAELAGDMARTASPDIRHIDPSLLWRRNGTRLNA